MSQVRPARCTEMHDQAASILRRAANRNPLDRNCMPTALWGLNHYAAALALLLPGSQFVPPGAFAQESLDHPSTIRGTVINRMTREPIGRALVYSPDNRFAQLTDEEGHFEYPIPKAAAADPGIFPRI